MIRDTRGRSECLAGSTNVILIFSALLDSGVYPICSDYHVAFVNALRLLYFMCEL